VKEGKKGEKLEGITKRTVSRLGLEREDVGTIEGWRKNMHIVGSNEVGRYVECSGKHCD